MPGWSSVQNDVLRELANLGAEAVAEAIAERTGVVHTAAAVQRQASRLGVSMVVFSPCPVCGRRVRGGRTGMCPACRARANAERQWRVLGELEAEAKRMEADPEYVAAKREYDRLRKAVSGKRRELRDMRGVIVED